MIIEERGCPRCRIRRTVRVHSSTSLCMNCKLQWPPSALPLEQSKAELIFTMTERRRLMIYRAAITAGMYSEFPFSESRTKP